MPPDIEPAQGGDGMTEADRGRALRIAAPIALGALFLAAWQAFVWLDEIPAYVLPGPLLIAETLWRDGPSLMVSLWVTLRITLAALAAAVLLGGALAILFAQSRLLEISLFPYAVVLQVTPIVAIAPLIIIWLKDEVFLSLVVCAWIVAFFPIVANTTLGLNSADRNLMDLFRLYRASPWQTLRYLRVPTALPYFLGGLRISGGLALIGAVVAEFVASTGGSETGLASRILEAGYRLQLARQFAALLLLALTGIAIFAALSWLTRRLIGHWHESVLPREE
jgi:NitT/TauT family transport system permease protein